MSNMKDITAKTIAIGGLSTMGLIATVPFLGGAALTGLAAYATWSIIGTASIKIATMKNKTPHQQLVNQIKSTFQYSEEDAEVYANKLNKMGLEEYRRAYDESTITKRD